MTVEHTSPQPQQVAFILYVAGVNIPVNSVSVSYSFMSFPVMQFTLPADPLLIKLGEEDRVPVVVFYLDKWYTPHKSQKIVPTWRLLFDGDITSWNFSKSSASKMISFTAVAHMNTLNAMTLVYMTGRGSEILNALSQTNTSIAQKAIKEDVQSLSFFTKGAYGTGEIKRPIDFVKNLLLGIKIGGSPKKSQNDEGSIALLKELDKEVKDVSSSAINATSFDKLRAEGSRKISAAMDFFIKYNHRNRLDKRWIASSVEELAIASSGSQNRDKGDKKVIKKTAKGSTEAIVKDTMFTQVIKRITFDAVATQFKGTTTPEGAFWNLITQFYRSTWYHVLLLPTAQLVMVDEAQDIPQDFDSSTLSDNIAHARLGNCISIPSMTYALPPACNVITPAMTHSFTYAEDYASQNTRTIVNGRSGFSTSRGGNATSQAQQYLSFRFGYPTDQNDLMEKSNTLKHSMENILIYPEEYFKGPIVSRPEAPSYFLTLEQNSRYTHNNVKQSSKDTTIKVLKGEGVPAQPEDKDVVKVNAGSWRQEMLYSFAKSYYLENRYSSRNGSINLNFNPYLVPGLPFTLIDNDDEDQMHLIGLITAVNISLSTASASTVVSYSAGRTLKETYEQVFTELTFGPEGGMVDLDTTTGKYDSYTVAPIMPVKVLADTLQVDENAAKYYQNLFYTNDKVNDTVDRPMVYRHSNYFKSTSGDTLVNEYNTRTKGKTTNKLSDDIKKKLKGKTFPGSISNVHQDETGKQIGSMDLELQVKDAQKDNINSYEKSMQQASRPICTLDEYMLMFNTKTRYTNLVSKKHTSAWDDEYGVPYPIKLREYYTLPETLNDSYIRPYARDPETMSTTSPEMRKDWPAKLMVYRSRIKEKQIIR